MPRHCKNHFFTPQGKFIVVLLSLSFVSILSYYILNAPDNQKIRDQISKVTDKLPEEIGRVIKDVYPK